MKLKFLSLIACFAVMAIAFSCTNSEQATEQASDTPTPQVTTISVDNLMANPKAYANQTIAVEGLCKHICKHGGTKAFIVNPDTAAHSENVVFCVATDKIEGAFSPEAPGKLITAIGQWSPIVKTRSEIVALANAEREAQSAEGDHCDSEARANGTATQWLAELQLNCTANGDTTLVVGYQLEVSSYTLTAPK